MNTNMIQARVVTDCGSQAAIRSIGSNGAASCVPLSDPRFGNPVIPNGGGSTSGGDCMMGTVHLFAGTFAPRGYLVADGRLLSISQNSALFSLVGTTYGGDGVTTFGLPNMQALAPAGVSYLVCASGSYPSRP